MTDLYSKTVQDTQLLVHKALEQLMESNGRMIELSEQMTELCEKFLEDTEEK